MSVWIRNNIGMISGIRPKPDIGTGDRNVCVVLLMDIVRFGRRGLEDVVRRHRATNPLEGKLANELDRYRLLRGLPDSWGNQNLTGLGFVAKARRDIGYYANRGVVSPPFKSDGPQRREAMRDADPKAKVVTKVAPFFN